VTTPGQNAPDGAWQFGDRMGQDMAGMTQSAVIDMMTAAARADLVKAVTGFNQSRGKLQSSAADLTDGQNALRGRLDLLQGITAHGTSVMSKNWAVDVLNTWKTLPFDTQVGPATRVGVTSDALVLKGGGLWRVDVHAAVSGYTIGLGSRINPVTHFLEFYNMYREIKPAYMIEIRDAAGELLSARSFDATPEPFYTEYAPPGNGLTGPYTTNYQTTFVIDRPDDTTADPDAWVYVRLLLRVEPSPSGFLNDTLATIHGGTRMCGLTAVRWSVDTDHLAHAPTVPDGGEL